MRINWPIAGIGIFWWLMETSYFGWNNTPQSVAELFADGASLAFYAAAFAFPPRAATAITITNNWEGVDT